MGPPLGSFFWCISRFGPPPPPLSAVFLFLSIVYAHTPHPVRKLIPKQHLHPSVLHDVDSLGSSRRRRSPPSYSAGRRFHHLLENVPGQGNKASTSPPLPIHQSSPLSFFLSLSNLFSLPPMVLVLVPNTWWWWWWCGVVWYGMVAENTGEACRGQGRLRTKWKTSTRNASK